MDRINLKSLGEDEKNKLIEKIRQLDVSIDAESLPEFSSKKVVYEILSDCMYGQLDSELNYLWSHLSRKSHEELIRIAMGWKHE